MEKQKSLAGAFRQFEVDVLVCTIAYLQPVTTSRNLPSDSRYTKLEGQLLIASLRLKRACRSLEYHDAAVNLDYAGKMCIATYASALYDLATSQTKSVKHVPIKVHVLARVASEHAQTLYNALYHEVPFSRRPLDSHRGKLHEQMLQLLTGMHLSGYGESWTPEGVPKSVVGAIEDNAKSAA